MQITKSEFRKLVFQSRVPSNTKLVVLALLEYMSGKDFECYPSMQTISIDCGLCRNSVLSAVKIAEKEGLFSTSKKRFKGSKFSVTVYTFPFQCSPHEQSNEQSNAHGFECSNDVSNDVSNERAPNGHKHLELKEPKEEDSIKEMRETVFVEFFKIYPKPTAANKARESFMRLMGEGVNAVMILNSVKNYARKFERMTSEERQYIKNPARWLDDGCYDDPDLQGEYITNDITEKPKIYRVAHERFGEHIANSWFSAVYLDGKTLIVGGQYAADWISNNYKSDMKDLFEKIEVRNGTP